MRLIMADNINISPDMINNLVNMLKNSETNNNSVSNSGDSNIRTDNNSAPNSGSISDTNNNPDSSNSDTSSNSSSINLGDIFSQFSSNTNSNSASNSNSNSDSNFSIDFETIMKMKSIMETLNNKNNPNSKLLYSLKPYLRKSKQAKLDQYANLLKITQMSNLFKNGKGDTK